MGIRRENHMFEDLNKELSEVKEKIRENQRLSLRLKELKKELENERKKQIDLKHVLDKEYKDVKKLESLSIGGLIYTLIGQKEEKIEKEKEEYILAKVRYDEESTVVSSLEIDIKQIEDRLKSFEGLEERYDSIIKKKEENILINQPENRIKLKKIEEKILDCKADIKELKEAIYAGYSLLEVIRKLVNSLESAANWGTLDMIGGGMLSTAIKHSHIDEAKSHSYEVKEYMKRFQRELKDVDRELNLDVSIGSFATFADYFFDGFFVDWYVQSSIREALNNAVSLTRSVESIVNRLGEEKVNSEEKITQLKIEYKRIIENAN